MFSFTRQARATAAQSSSEPSFVQVFETDEQLHALDSLGDNIENTRVNLQTTQSSYSGIVQETENMLRDLDAVNSVLADLDSFVQNQSHVIGSVMQDVELLKRIG